MLRYATLSEALEALGALLDARGESHDLALIGGGALLLLGLIERPTRDLDAVGRFEGDQLLRAEPFPPSLTRAVVEVGRALDLPEDWLNPGPAGLVDFGLPSGFVERLETRRFGSLTIRLASRRDHIAFKLYAAVDQGPHSKHFADLQRLEPTSEELLSAARWTRTHDPSDGFAMMLQQAVATLGVESDGV